MHRLLTGKLQVERLTIAIANLPPQVSGTKLVQLTDFHYDGLRLSEWLLEEAIAATNQAKPDLILLTGDYITKEPEPIHSLVQQLKNLQSGAGIYAILGNHDYYLPGAKTEVIKALTDIGIQVLYNEVAYPLGSELALVGLADFWSHEFKPGNTINNLASFSKPIPSAIYSMNQWQIACGFNFSTQ